MTGTAGPALDTFARRAADVIDVPLVPLAELLGADDVARLAAFDGWIAAGEYDAGRAPLLDRAEALVHHDLPAPVSLTGIVRRTLRRVRAELGAEPDAWVATAAAAHPALPVVRLTRADDVEHWLRAVGG